MVGFLQQLLDGLAKVSGYEEVATVPWLPLGESGHLLMVNALVETAPQRCIAGVWLKNNDWAPTNREVPALTIFGSAQEWNQEKTDYRTHWDDVVNAYNNVLNVRKSNPDYPLSYVIDGTSGHFDLSERLTQYVARYIDQVAKARLPANGGAKLNAIKLDKGFLADPARAGTPKIIPSPPLRTRRRHPARCRGSSTGPSPRKRRPSAGSTGRPSPSYQLTRTGTGTCFPSTSAASPGWNSTTASRLPRRTKGRR